LVKGSAMVELTVVGVCSYAPAVHRWLRTMRAHFDGRCLLYLTDPPEEVAEALKSLYGIEVISVSNAAHFWDRRARGMYTGQWKCVLDACTKHVNRGLILRTDVWDVVFQDDPRKYLEADCAKILVAHEGVNIGAEGSNRAWVGPWLNLFGEAPVINSGMVCGLPRSLAVLAALLLKAPLGTRIDQADFELIANAFDHAFEYRPGFLECMYRTYFARGTVLADKICDRESGRPWCVVHGNGGRVKQLFDCLYPI
jgi:hypothetical protein